MDADKLAKYQTMRDFTQTDEPAGAIADTRGNAYVIQKHAASHLHYDFRLELDGVLLSWSVPKGPSLAPKNRRLAVRTEDHPISYGSFEGTIPKGQYGGGTVAVWDRGTWQPEGDPREMMRKGRLKFTLAGEKLRGRWNLIRTQPRGKQESWLLFKGRDEAADDKVDIVAAKPDSVASGRSIEQIAAGLRPQAKRQRRREQPATTPASGDLDALALTFPLTSLDRVVFPDPGTTKGELFNYLVAVAPRMLPHVVGRPLSIVRCPGGQGNKCFYQKHRLSGAPEAIKSVRLEEADGDQAEYMAIADVAGLVALAQHGTLEIHTWGARADNVEKPDIAVFDLDPDVELPFDEVTHAALAVRDRLADLGLQSFAKTTGGKGLHVVVPIQRRLAWESLKGLTRRIAEDIAHAAPTRFTTNMAKRARKGKIFLDYLRNGRGATFVAPYSPRARPGALVATPVSWNEVEDGLDPHQFSVASVTRRLQAPDPWADFFEIKQALSRGKLARLRSK